MTLQDELFNLFDQEKQVPECIEMGYKRATVYRLFKKWQEEKEKEQLKALIDESEVIKKVFSALQGRWELRKIVSEYGIPPARVIELHENYVKLAEIELGFKKKLDRIDETTERIKALSSEKADLEAVSKELRSKIDKMIENSGKSFKKGLDSRKYDLEYEVHYLENKLYFQDSKDEKKAVEQQITVKKAELDSIERFLNAESPRCKGLSLKGVIHHK